MKIHFSQSSLQEVEQASILDDIAKTKFALETVYSNFDNVTDHDLIDCYIFEINAIMKRYKYLLEQAAKINLLPESSCEKSSIDILIP